MEKTTDEINRYIHSEIMKVCLGDWGDRDRYGGAWHEPPCLQCGKTWQYHLDVPDYCSAAEKRSYLNEAIDALCAEYPTPIGGEYHFHCALLGIMQDAGNPKPSLVRATAEQIARACAQAAEECKTYGMVKAESTADVGAN